MPKENRKRGRREEQKKRKRDADDGELTAKRAKKDEVHVESIEVGEAFQQGEAADVTRPEQMTFYGMLDEEEQEYFKRADEMLELNQFEDSDARKLFLESVYKEADGKELKIANSQSCSRLLERLILLSTPAQLKNLFQKFSGQYVHQTLLPSNPCSPAAASSISSSTDSPPTAAKPFSSTPPPSSPSSLPNRKKSRRRRRLIRMPSLCLWRACSSIP